MIIKQKLKIKIKNKSNKNNNNNNDKQRGETDEGETYKRGREAKGGTDVAVDRWKWLQVDEGGCRRMDVDGGAWRRMEVGWSRRGMKEGGGRS